ncbi:MAG TPA: C2 family cysteine protease [Gemmatales bacterium]|nr:C2 family cysteine protease [Gemmatales bacterium]
MFPTKVFHSWLILIVLGLGTRFAQADGRKLVPSPFAATVLTHFEEWDLNHNGVLDPDELDKLVMNRSIRGDAAAALGTLKSIQRRGKVDLPKLDVDYFNNYAQSVAQKNLKGYPPFEAQFNAAKKKTADTSRVIFPPGQPSLRGVHQGSLGDCFFLASLASMIARDPAGVHQLITREPNGEYLIEFPGAKKVRVQPLTDAELALTSTTQGQGLWLNLFEKGYGQLRNEALKGDKKTLCATDAICKGGSPKLVLQDLTGHQVKWMNLHRVTKEKEPVPPEKIADEVHQVLMNAQQAKRLMCAVTPQEQKAKGVSPHHAYTVLSYDASTRMLYLFNPHGNSWTPRGEPGLANGYATKSGRFGMPLTEFVECYQALYFETSELLKK